MRLLQLHSESVSPSGGLVSEGVLNQLGRPRMDRLTMLTREAGQNSWDARSGVGPVRFDIDCHRLTDEQGDVLSNVVFADRPFGLPEGSTELSDPSQDLTREATKTRLLVVSDRGTTGLGGPTRADTVSDRSGPRDYVDFLLTTGQPPDHVAGGTYGFGKTAFYLASARHTILVYSRCMEAERPESRFIAAALGAGHVAGNRRYTGRHWWGRLDGEVAEPLRDGEADEVAAALGLRTFAEGELGTTVVVVDPLLDGQIPAVAMRRVARAILWNFWPKILPGTSGEAAMHFGITCDGQIVEIPDPRTTPPLDGFAEALGRLRPVPGLSGNILETKVFSIESERPRARLGGLAVVKFGVSVPHELTTTDAADGAGTVGTPTHHVALMRGEELVVRYVEGPVLSSADVQYAGVFKVDEGVEAAFAHAEPPTHDEWSPDNLEDPWEKRYVRIAQTRIQQRLQDYASPRPLDPTPATGGSLGGFSSQLGFLFLGIDQSGITHQGLRATREPAGEYASGPPRGRARPARPTVNVASEGRLELRNGQRALIVEFDIRAAEGSEASEVRAIPAVMLEGNATEIDPPVGDDIPAVVGWLGPDGRLFEGDHVQIAAGDNGRWSVVVGIPSDALVTVSIESAAVSS